MWVYGLDWAGPGQRQVADACECGRAWTQFLLLMVDTSGVLLCML